MGEDSRFWDRIAAKYAAQPVADEAAYQRKLEMTRKYLTPETEMLEFGCGTGSTALAHAPHVRHVRATDLSAAMLEIARGKAEAARIGNVEFEQASIETLEGPEGGYDAVLGMSLLHLLRDPEAALAKCFRLTRPGGRFFSSTTCMTEIRFARAIRVAVTLGQWIGRLPYVNFFGRDRLEAMIRVAGFEIEEAWQPGPGKAVFIIARRPETPE